MSAGQITQERIAELWNSLGLHDHPAWNGEGRIEISCRELKALLTANDACDGLVLSRQFAFDDLERARAEVQRLTEELNRALGPTNRQLHEEAAGMPLDDVFFRMSGIDPEGRRPAAVQGVELPDIPSTPPKGLARERFPGRDEDRERMGFVDGWQECREWFASRLSPSPQPATGAVVDIPDLTDNDYNEHATIRAEDDLFLRVGYELARSRFKALLTPPPPSADVVVVPREEWEATSRDSKQLKGCVQEFERLKDATMKDEKIPFPARVRDSLYLDGVLAVLTTNHADALRSSTNHDAKAAGEGR